tara:strand:- start:237 stop:1478 length:1242 start_codon:yes stop_codon:yes gene_type:complete
MIINFQIPILHLFGFEIKGLFEKFIWADINIANKSVAISTISILGYYFSYILANPLKSSGFKVTTSYSKSSSMIFLIIGSYLMYFAFFITSGSYKYGYYGNNDQLIISNYFSAAFNVFLPAMIVTKLYYINSIVLKDNKINTYIKAIGMPVSVLTFWHIMFSFFIGDRGPVISYGLLFFSLFLIQYKKIKFRHFLLILVLASVTFAIIKEARTRTSVDSYSDRLSNAYLSYTQSEYFNAVNIPMQTTVDLALSIRNLNHALYQVPENHEYMFGHYQMLQLLSCFPGLAGIYHKIILDNEYEYQGSSFFLTYMQYGKNAESGEGTMPAADLYLDFGIVGVIVGFLLFGFLSKKIDSTIINKKQVPIFFWILTLIYFSGSVYIGRATFLFYLQDVVQIYFLILFNNVIVRSLKSG